MTYTKPDQAPYASQLLPGEFVVILDTGEAVAARAVSEVEPTTGQMVVKATARAVEADGSTRIDANGHPIATAYAFTADTDTINALGGPNGFQRKMLLTVLGEDVLAAWPNPLPPDVLEQVSIRSTLASAAFAGPVQDPGSLL